MVYHLLNRALVAWRRVDAGDGAGGQSTTWTPHATVRCRLAQSAELPRTVAEQAGAEHTVVVLLAPKTDIRRSERLAEPGQRPDVRPWLEVRSVTQPSTSHYLRADCERV